MRILLISILMLCQLYPVRAQKNKQFPASLQPDQMKADFDYLRNLLENTAPGLYAHQTPERVRHIFDSLRGTLNSPLPFLAFYGKISFMIAELHCEHSHIVTSDAGHAALSKQFRYFPFQPDFSGNKPIVLVNGTSDTTIYPGDEITRINGTPIEQILRELYHYLPGDGFITSGKAHTLSSAAFGFYYNLFKGPAKAYEVEFKNRSGDIITRQYASELSLADINRNAYANPVNRDILSAAAYYGELNKKKIRLELDSLSGAAFLTVASFGLDKARFRSLIDSCFEQINHAHIRNLVIDLSYNDGGEEELALYLMSYLVRKPTSFVESEYLLTDKDEHLAMATGIPKKIAGNKYAYISPLTDGKSMVKLSEFSMELAVIQPHSNAFMGKTYIYVNGGTASAASTFAAVAQFNQLASIVGTETSGAYKGGGVAIGIEVTLPNSFIRTHHSLAFMNFATAGRDGSRGVMPDYTYAPTYDDIIRRNIGWKQFVKTLFR